MEELAPNEGLILKLFVRFLEIEFVKSKMHGLTFYKGAFNNYVDRILPFFDSPPCVDSFYTLSVDKKRHYLIHSSPPSHVVNEWPLMENEGACDYFFLILLVCKD